MQLSNAKAATEKHIIRLIQMHKELAEQPKAERAQTTSAVAGNEEENESPVSAKTHRKVIEFLRFMQELDNLPSARLRKRIDYYIRPYNKDYLYAKYMTFGDLRRTDNEEACHHEWRKISDLILKKDKALFHDIIKHMRDSPGPNESVRDSPQQLNKRAKRTAYQSRTGSSPPRSRSPAPRS